MLAQNLFFFFSKIIWLMWLWTQERKEGEWRKLWSTSLSLNSLDILIWSKGYASPSLKLETLLSAHGVTLQIISRNRIGSRLKNIGPSVLKCSIGESAEQGAPSPTFQWFCKNFASALQTSWDAAKFSLQKFGKNFGWISCTSKPSNHKFGKWLNWAHVAVHNHH